MFYKCIRNTVCKNNWQFPASYHYFTIYANKLNEIISATEIMHPAAKNISFAIPPALNMSKHTPPDNGYKTCTFFLLNKSAKIWDKNPVAKYKTSSLHTIQTDSESNASARNE